VTAAFNRAVMAKAPPQNAGVTLSGAAQKLVGATAASRCIEVVNIGNASIGLSFLTATPVIGASDTMTVAAGGTWRSFEGFLPNADLYVIGTAAQKVACWYF
jgi:hypothetical protein